ncbi:hypothetical protein [Streptomyces sp. SCUT-3]|uniref:hypothetical protein n=1 Tax=Streptomyces sp. SCUT-3 TaxID=2684469 RepID=UPI001C7148B4|nr:hypothetical protein [Streptomyces sp. SCUT-3]
MTANRIPLSELERGTPFEQRHIGPDDAARAKMLAQVGYGSLDELTAAAVPDAIKSAAAWTCPRRAPRSRCSPNCVPWPTATRSSSR